MIRLHHLAFLVVLFGCWNPEDERSISEMDNFNPFDENFEFPDNINLRNTIRF